MATQAIKKKEGGLFNFQDFKKKNLATVAQTANKPQSWLLMPPAYVQQTGLPGLPCCKLSIIRGWSDTGKTTLRNLAIAAAMRRGDIPVIFSTDGDFSYEYAKACGMQIKPEYGDRTVTDPMTGEETVLHNQIINWIGDYIVFTPTTIDQECNGMDYAHGKAGSKPRGQAVIEDVAYIINKLLSLQASGELPRNLFFVWDSLNSLPSYQSWSSKANNNMWNAGAINNSFESVVGAINSTIEQGHPYENTMLWIVKLSEDHAASMMPGVTAVKEKGGRAVKYFNRLTIHLGKKATSGVKKLKATYKGVEYAYATLTQIEIVKNHLDKPFDVTQSGTLVCVGDGIITEGELDEYKKTHMADIVAHLQAKLAEAGRENEKIDVSSVDFSEEDSNDN